MAAACLVVASVLLAACGEERVRSPGETIVTGGTEVFVIERQSATPSSDRPTILFLHGASFDADVWVRTGILDAVAAAGFDALAVDLPGYGETASTAIFPAEFLSGLVRDVDDGSGVVVVSPSMSGSFSLALLHDDPSVIAGFVPVAPVGITDFASSTDPIDQVPTLVVWGEDDDVIDPTLGDELVTVLTNSERVTIPDAGHAAYVDQPDAFSTALLLWLVVTYD